MYDLFTGRSRCHPTESPKRMYNNNFCWTVRSPPPLWPLIKFSSYQFLGCHLMTTTTCRFSFQDYFNILPTLSSLLQNSTDNKSKKGFLKMGQLRTDPAKITLKTFL